LDFSFTEEQETVRELAARILGDLSTPERLKEVPSDPDHIDRKLWTELAEAGLLSIALPESCGGSGLGFLAAGIVAEEAGRVAAAVPYSATAVWAALPIARFGTDQQKKKWLDPLPQGREILTAALSESGADPWHPATTARRDGSRWRLDGAKDFVPVASAADVMVVSARVGDDGAAATDSQVGLFLVEKGSSGVHISVEEATDGRLEAAVELSGVEVAEDAVLVAPSPGSADALNWTLERAQAATCLEIAGACQSAVKLTAEYTSSREQFGKPVATFQAVGQRAADAFIDAQAVRLTALQAAWRLGEELPASAEVATAKFWADDGAQRVVLAAQHLHGGVGVDRDYPLHRYFLLVKHLALTLGGTTPSLLRLGRMLASEPA
jgi:alkylation response protein AidB-like acyl-CoA dehydrogenase